MRDRSIRRRKLLAGSFTAGIAGTAGCLNTITKASPDAAHWAAGIQWSDSPGEVAEKRLFFPEPPLPDDYLRVNGGELREMGYSQKSIPADRGDHIEYIVDFNRMFQREETVFEYTIPTDDDLVVVLASFAECRYYRNSDEWIIRPLNVNLGTDVFGRQKETLVVQVYPEEEPYHVYIWGHTESNRDKFRDRAADSDHQFDLEFLDSGEEEIFPQTAFDQLEMDIDGGNNRIAHVDYSQIDDTGDVMLYPE